MGASTGHRAEGVDQKKSLLVQTLVAQPGILKSRLLERPLWSPTTWEVYWNRLDEDSWNKDL